MEHVGREQTETVLGETLTFGRWTRAVWSEYFAFAREILPDPIEAAAKHLDKLPQVQGEFLVRIALDKACSYLSVNSPEITSLLNSIEGGSHLAYLLLKEKQPKITREDAYDVFMSLAGRPTRKQTPDELKSGTPAPNRMQEIFSLAAGRGSGGNVEAPAVSV